LIASRALLRSVAVVRFRIWLATAVAFGAIVAGLLRAQIGEEQQRDQSEQTEKPHSSSPKPKKSPTPTSTGKPSTRNSPKKHRPSPTPEKAPTAIPRAKLAGADSSWQKSREEEDTTPASTPRETPEPSVSLKTKRRHTPTPKPKTAKKKSGAKEASGKAKKKAKSKSVAQEKETPKPKKTPAPRVEEEHAASEKAALPPHPTAAPTPAPALQPKPQRAASTGEQPQVVIEKSGIEEDQGFEPPPSPPPRRLGFWPWSRPVSYRYLTSSVIEAIRRAPVKRRRWQFIVVHNSGTRQGNARVFDYYHRHVRRMQNGLAYHFVIGNGTSTGNGQIEIGDRWRRQINGGHVHSDYLNNISLGICLVGDFNRDQPTRAQLDACEELIRYLRDRCGGTGRGAIPVKPHREMNPPRWPTDCPGDDFPYSWFRRF
jgi:hypothetical protein